MKITEELIKKSYSDALKRAKQAKGDEESESKVVLQQVTKEHTNIVLDVSSLSSSCCGSSESSSSSCGPSESLNTDQNISFGCIRLQEILEQHVQKGNTVIDFGSGPGHDLFMAARLVGKKGKAFGVDFTDSMIEEASLVARNEGLTQVELVKANIDKVPLPDNSADFIISNCVINLAINKQDVFNEAYRLLKPGGMLIDADVISDKPLSNELQSNNELWCSCVGGALTSDEYKEKLKHSGFSDVSIDLCDKSNITFDAKQFGIYSGVIFAKKY